MNVKCNPEKAQELRSEYDGVKPGFHMNKKHWNSLYIDKLIEKFVFECIKDLYNLVQKNRKT
ncbi:MAG: MmcQ/YjbR family DNA-binding protein [Chitinophagaceae bacterium]